MEDICAIAIVISAFAAAPARADETGRREFPLVRGGMATCRIMLSPDAGPTEKHAAAELAGDLDDVSITPKRNQPRRPRSAAPAKP
jgi:hypothetical protein